MTDPAAPPDVSLVIPVHQEEAILRAAASELREALQARGQPWELVFAENGSSDDTLSILHQLAHEHPEIRHISTGVANYGHALRAGILAARGEKVISDEIDLGDTDFYERALGLLTEGVDLVVGSKLAPGAVDRRPLGRHLGSVFYSGALRALYGFSGTDTHGPKAFWRERLLPIVEACRVDGDVFSSELVIRAHRAGLEVREIPITVTEKRPPSVRIIQRAPRVLADLLRLGVGLRLRG